MPPRPPAVELAAAILLVTGIIGVISNLGAGLGGTADPFLWLGVLLNATSALLGLAARYGRLWVVTLNYAAVLGFLDLLGSGTNAQALMIGLAEVLVVVMLILNKPWFDAIREWRRAVAPTP